MHFRKIMLLLLLGSIVCFAQQDYLFKPLQGKNEIPNLHLQDLAACKYLARIKNSPEAMALIKNGYMALYIQEEAKKAGMDVQRYSMKPDDILKTFELARKADAETNWTKSVIQDIANQGIPLPQVPQAQVINKLLSMGTELWLSHISADFLKKTEKMFNVEDPLTATQISMAIDFLQKNQDDPVAKEYLKVIAEVVPGDTSRENYFESVVEANHQIQKENTKNLEKQIKQLESTQAEANKKLPRTIARTISYIIAKELKPCLEAQKQALGLVTNQMQSNFSIVKRELNNIQKDINNIQKVAGRTEQKMDVLIAHLIPSVEEQKRQQCIAQFSTYLQHADRIIHLAAKLGLPSGVVKVASYAVQAGSIALSFYSGNPVNGVLGLVDMALSIFGVGTPDVAEQRHQEIMKAFNFLAEGQKQIIELQKVVIGLQQETLKQIIELRKQLYDGLNQVFKGLQRLESLIIITQKQQWEQKASEIYGTSDILLDDIADFERSGYDIFKILENLDSENLNSAYKNMNELMNTSQIHPLLAYKYADIEHSEYYQQQTECLKEMVEKVKKQLDDNYDYKVLFNLLQNEGVSVKNVIEKNGRSYRLNQKFMKSIPPSNISYRNFLAEEKLFNLISPIQMLQTNEYIEKMHLYFDFLFKRKQILTFEEMTDKFGKGSLTNQELLGYMLQKRFSAIMKLTVAQQRLIHGEALSLLLADDPELQQKYFPHNPILAKNFVIGLIWYNLPEYMRTTPGGLQEYPALLTNQTFCEYALRNLLSQQYSIRRNERGQLELVFPWKIIKKEPNKAEEAFAVTLPSYQEIRQGYAERNLNLALLLQKNEAIQNSLFNYEVLNQTTITGIPSETLIGEYQLLQNVYSYLMTVK